MVKLKQIFPFSKGHPTKYDYLKFSTVSRAVRNPFDRHRMLLPHSFRSRLNDTSLTLSGPSVQSAIPPCLSYPADGSLGVCPPIALGSHFLVQRLIPATSSFSVRLVPSRLDESISMSPRLSRHRCHAPPPLSPRSIEIFTSKFSHIVERSMSFNLIISLE
jgi:hypothetical protein